MTDPYQQPLRGAALYNPHLHGKQELISLFAARKDLLEILLEDIRLSWGRAPQHHLIIGQRGMGKTMLLRRIAYAIEDDLSLKDTWLPLSFPEEQYNVACLSDFWLNCTDALSDLLDARGEHGTSEELDEKAESLRSVEEDRRAREALTLLVGIGNRLGRRLVLLVDNVDLVFERIKDQEWLLREVLSSEPSLLLIGASANAVESTFTYDQAFYDFFRVHELEGLSLEETQRLLIHYAEIWQQPEVKRLANQEPARIKVLHNLTGGNPRTIALLFNVLAAGADGDVRTDLEKLLDQCTPLYKARFEALSPQAQQVVHAMAVHWDPVSAGELAELLGMEVNTVSSQLTRLVKQGVVEKVVYDPESKTGFQVSERFFNIWYLMRASRRVRRRLLWLVEFLKIFYSQDQLRDKALTHIESGLSLDPSRRLRYAEYSFALAEAMSDRVWRRSLESSGLHVLLKDDTLRSQLAELIDLEDSEPSLKERAELQQRLEHARPLIISSKVELPGWSGEDFWGKLERSLLFSLDAKVKIAENLSSFGQNNIGDVKAALDSELERLRAVYVCPKTIAALTKAVQAGLMSGPADVEGATRADSILGAPGLRAIALANLLNERPDRELLPMLENELTNTTSLYPGLTWLNQGSRLEPPLESARIGEVVEILANLSMGDKSKVKALGNTLVGLGHLRDAEDLFRRHLETNGADADIWIALGQMLAAKSNRYEEAEEALRAGLKIIPEDGDAWAWLSIALLWLGRFIEAEQAGRQAVKLRPEESVYWLLVGFSLLMLGKVKDFEGLLEKIIGDQPDNALSLFIHGLIYIISDRREDGVIALRKAYRLDPDLASSSTKAAWSLWQQGDCENAKLLAAESVRIDADASGVLAAVLAREGDWPAAAQQAKNFISAVVEKDLEGNWPQTHAFFREAVRAGKAREAAAILDEVEASQKWRPLREALEAIARGSDSYLRRVAPEVRQPAREILKQLREEPSVGTPPKAPTAN